MPEGNIADKSLVSSSDRKPPRPFTHDDYTIAIICPMGDEMSPVLALLHETHENLSTSRDQNAYKLGAIGQHNIVVAGMPIIGNNAASMVVTQLLNDFRRIRFGLLVGVGGGIPDENYDDEDLVDIRLGDVVVSESRGTFGGVVQFDRGKSTTEGFIKTGHQNKPPHVLAANVETLKAVHNLHGNSILPYFDEMIKNYPGMEEKYSYPGLGRDRLFEASYTHQGGKTCKKCDSAQTVERSQRKSSGPRIHYGTIGSSNRVVEDTKERDELRDMGILCVEMEAAGLMEAFPCLVIRGISDYADSHKNKKWQPYAAAMAAAYMKELLLQMPTDVVQRTQSIADALQGMSVKFDQMGHDMKSIKGQNQSAEEAKILEWLSSKDTNFSTLQNESQRTHTAGTGQWLLDAEQYQDWRDREPGLMWLCGAGGSTVVCDLQAHATNLAYWYFRFNSATSQDISKMLRSITRQLSYPSLPSGVRALYDRHSQRGSEPSLAELTTILDNTIATFKDDVYIVFDALDECPHNDKNGQRDHLLRCIKDLLETNPNLHLLVTSRPESDIRKALVRLASCLLDIEELVKNDVERYVKHSLDGPRLASWAEDVKDKIRQKLLEYEERRFRWADLQLKRFAQCATLKKLEAAMASIPKDLETSYSQAFEAIDQNDIRDVATIMKWLTVSIEPLDTNQIAAVVGFRSSDYVLDICSTLLVTVIDEDTTQIIKLAHFSVKEFLIVKLHENSTHWFHFSSELANNAVAVAALQALLNTKDESQPIVRYAARNWPQHATLGLKTSDHIELESQISLLFSVDYMDRFCSWLEIHDPDGEYKNHFLGMAQGLYYASLLGFNVAAKMLLEAKADVNAQGGHYGNALQAASLLHMEDTKRLCRY
ncbi:hypothetical protein TruAng_008492 [Truncatella angustata]|nr:hypothetical protein TruAng_008492 [Truncatella angustata]